MKRPWPLRQGSAELLDAAVCGDDSRLRAESEFDRSCSEESAAVGIANLGLPV